MRVRRASEGTELFPAASLQGIEATRMSEKKLHLLLAEGDPGETACALLALYLEVNTVWN